MRHISKAELFDAVRLETKDETGSAVEQAIAALASTTEAKIGELRTELKAAQDRADELETKMARPAVAGDDKATPEQKAFTGYLKSGREALSADEVKSLRVSDDTAGGYLAPDEFIAEVIKGIVERSPIRQAARVGNTSAGNVILPKRTGRPTARWVGETETRTGTESTYGQLDIEVFEMACYVDVSQRLLEDAAVNVEAEVSSDLSEEFARLEALAFSQGDGVKKPVGIMEAAGVPYTFSGNASTLGSAPADLLIDAFYALPAFYRGRGTWLMNGKTLAAIRKLKDGSTGAYLWQPGLTLDTPDTILGRPVIEDPTMDDIGSAAEPILFGDIASAYRIYDRVGLSILRDPYSVATSGLVRFHARRRVGAGLVLAEALRKIRCATS
ncbi:phage major capsid protein [Mesorhizobium sp. IMUNJ 23232]|uniref:phage major capsid protein n=1 Tax=Mesorhizobium sp. IMUNJ 23232 TaxID=3376064 RepID=UPI0037B6BE70